MDEFLKTWYGLALFIAFDVAAALVVMAIAYRWIFKALLGRGGGARLYGGALSALSRRSRARENL